VEGSGKKGGGGVRENEALKTATAIVGLLAGVVAVVYVLGGLVIALRLVFDHFSIQGAVTAVGQLPRQAVVTMALLNVVGPAVAFGILAAILYGLLGRPRPRGEFAKPTAAQKAAAREGARKVPLFSLRGRAFYLLSARPRGSRRHLTEAQKREWDQLGQGSRWRVALLFGFFVLLAAAGSLPALREAVAAEDVSPLLIPCIVAAVISFGLIAAGWYLIRRVAREGDWSRIGKALVAGAIWAAVALIPALMLASAKPFEHAQVCVDSELTPIKGRLVGESSDRLFLEEEFGREAALLALPAEDVTKSESGDLSSAFTCPPRPGEKQAAVAAGAVLNEHGKGHELTFARALRPRLLFDSRERWRPIGVGAFLAEEFPDGSTHEACFQGPRAARRCRAVAGLGQLQPGDPTPRYIDIHGHGEDVRAYASPDPLCHSQETMVVDCNEGPRAVIYYRRTTHQGRWYWDYWWFMRYNDYGGPLSKCNEVNCSDHEGDWEGITVVTTAAEEPVILGAIYAAHRNRILMDADEMPLAGGRPVVYVAAGTHASYPFRCAQGCDQYAKLGGVARLPEERHDGAVAWGNNNDTLCKRYNCVKPLPEVGNPSDTALPLAGGWAGWAGLWGRNCQQGCDSFLLQGSPRGPGLQARFECPWAATDEAMPAPDGSGLSRAETAGDAQRLFAYCRAQRGGH
jgi:hypothetical protein